MRIVSLFLVSIMVCTSCAQRAMHMPKQGLTGEIIEVRGNQMPSPDRPRTGGRGVSREIYIYSPTTPEQTEGGAPLFTAIKSKLIATIRSDSSGKYQVALPRGKYSVFVKDAAGFFASESDATGIICPIEVPLNAVVVKNVLINHAAAY